MHAKIVNGFVVLAPTQWRQPGGGIKSHYDRILQEQHYRDMPEEDLARAVIDLVHPPIRYSQLKIINALGSQWEAFRRELEKAALSEPFFNEENLSSNDERFRFFLSEIRGVLKERLDSCVVE